jgi:hypothetical protein
MRCKLSLLIHNLTVDQADRKDSIPTDEQFYDVSYRLSRTQEHLIMILY